MTPQSLREWSKARQRWLVLFVILFLLFLQLIIQYRLRLAPQKNVDLASFYWAANITFHNHQSPYERGDSASLQVRRKIHQFEREWNVKLPPFLYPPPSLLIFYPLSLVSYRAAQQGMFILNLISILFLS